MSYSTELTKPTSDKIAFVEFDIGRVWNRFEEIDSNLVIWVSYHAGIFYTRFDGTFPDINADWIQETPAEASVTKVGTVFYTSTLRLTEKTAVADMWAEPSFYWDRTDEVLYVHLLNGDPPELYNIRIGISTQVAQKHWIDETVGNQYDAELVSLPSVKRSIDPLFFGRISFDDAQFELENTAGKYDNLTDLDIYGQTVRMYFGFGNLGYADLEQIWTGYLDSVSLSEERVTVDASDQRRALQTPLPPNRFDSTTYTDLKDNDVDKPIPLAYGAIRKAEVTCVNRDAYDKASAQDLTFKLADMTNHTAINAITSAFHKDEELTTNSADDIYIKSTDLSTAEIVINKAADVEFDFRDFQVTFEGYVDGSSNLIEDGLDVIKDLIVNHTDALYNSSWFNTTTWGATTSEDVYLYVAKEEDVIDVIEQITASIRIQFDITGDGLYTVREYSDFKTPVAKIYADELLEPIELAYDSEQWVSRATVEYSNGLTYVDTSEESAVKERFKQARNRTFETLLTTETDAIAFADETLSYSKKLRPLVNIVTKTQHTGVNIEDHIYVQINRRGGEWLGWTRCRVEGITYDLTAFTTTIAARVLASGLIDDKVDGGDATGTGATIVDGGTATADYTEVLDGGNASLEYTQI